MASVAMAQGIVTISSAALAPPYFSSPQNLTSSQQASFDSMQDICTVTSDSGLLCIGANGNQAIAAVSKCQALRSTVRKTLTRS